MQERTRRRRRPEQAIAGKVASLLFLAVAVAVLQTPSGTGGACQEASRTLALSLFRRGGKPKVLFQYRDYELLWIPRSKGRVLPRLNLRKTPPRPVAMGPFAGSVDGALNRELLGFPFTTGNAGSAQLDFPRVSGHLRLSVEDPPTSSSLEGEEQQRAIGAAYQQQIAGVGDLAVRVKTTGEWSASLSREVEDLGRLDGTVNHQLDWSLDLESTYPAVKGIVPSVTYGATQDGMHLRGVVGGPLGKQLHGTYSVKNQPGQYSPADFAHDASLTFTSGKSRHVLRAQGTYDRKLPQVPVRGSLSYTTRIRPVTVEASIDHDNYRLRANAGVGQVSAAVARKEEAGVRPAVVQLQLGKVSLSAKLGKDTPRLRVELAQ